MKQDPLLRVREEFELHLAMLLRRHIDDETLRKEYTQLSEMEAERFESLYKQNLYKFSPASVIACDVIREYHQTGSFNLERYVASEDYRMMSEVLSGSGLNDGQQEGLKDLLLKGAYDEEARGFLDARDENGALIHPQPFTLDQQEFLDQHKVVKLDEQGCVGLIKQLSQYMNEYDKAVFSKDAEEFLAKDDEPGLTVWEHIAKVYGKRTADDEVVKSQEHIILNERDRKITDVTSSEARGMHFDTLLENTLSQASRSMRENVNRYNSQVNGRLRKVDVVASCFDKTFSSKEILSGKGVYQEVEDKINNILKRQKGNDENARLAEKNTQIQADVKKIKDTYEELKRDPSNGSRLSDLQEAIEKSGTERPIIEQANSAIKDSVNQINQKFEFKEKRPFGGKGEKEIVDYISGAQYLRSEDGKHTLANFLEPKALHLIKIAEDNLAKAKKTQDQEAINAAKDTVQFAKNNYANIKSQLVLDDVLAEKREKDKDIIENMLKANSQKDMSDYVSKLNAPIRETQSAVAQYKNFPEKVTESNFMFADPKNPEEIKAAREWIEKQPDFYEKYPEMAKEYSRQYCQIFGNEAADDYEAAIEAVLHPAEEMERIIHSHSEEVIKDTDEERITEVTDEMELVRGSE